MVTLQQKQPKFYQYLHDGEFVVRWSFRRFIVVATDYGHEQAMNCERKSQGGVIGFTLRKGAHSRWMATSYITALHENAPKQQTNNLLKTMLSTARQGWQGMNTTSSM